LDEIHDLTKRIAERDRSIHEAELELDELVEMGLAAKVDGGYVMTFEGGRIGTRLATLLPAVASDLGLPLRTASDVGMAFVAASQPNPRGVPPS